jgi:hypothetical protein
VISNSTARVTFPLLWQHKDGPLPFDCVVSGWNTADPIRVVDMHPGNAGTWEWFEQR